MHTTGTYPGLKPILHLMLAPLAALWVGSAQAETVSLSGVGLSAPLMQRLAEGYHRLRPHDSVTVVVPPLGSSGAVRALAAGELDLAISGRPLKPEEEAHTGNVTELARTAFCFASSDGVLPTGLTIQKLADIYAGRLTHWDDGQPIRLVMRPEFETDTMLVRQIAPQVDAAMTLATQRKGLIAAINDLDTLALLEKVPGSFGPTTTGLITLQQRQVRCLPFNGVQPSARALAEGRYPLAKVLYSVTPAQLSPATERFLAYLHSPAAQEIMTTAGFLPAAP